ncbi:MAG: 1-(5-phosphoribosyl)-5-[(5-phosphoribosylamino)methylideneamino]imidazole-4-carboxamide isomerase [Alteromonas sp.]|nr:1-(5-phosphoribosyl)-5-[(5-phosphoribosylamino)methylideneamino]imidazole-4-carboxamide isomerase [Alteromonas sp.]MAY22671.1 1-(5-phosphoribosyl)-5-[(5-phosphoribosylamino)methylideneamino]imidazole-4-carboxamide isomerase [Flavobacteriaceae bacterium]|tara:strand:- start:59 stop:772 length:714 start_codon:yes stop_codon:yes gene_type:complete
MKIIPALDIIDGKCVRLSQGDYNTQKIYNENPLEVAQQLEGAGLQYLHLVDLDGAKAQKVVNYKVLETIASKTRLHIDFGGGLKSSQDLKIAFESGAQQITGGSIAVAQPEVFLQWLGEYGPEKILLGADCKNRMIATHGWLKQAGWEVLDFIKTYEKQGVTQVVCTDIAKDGMLEGPSFGLYEEILKETSVQLIASGGIASLEDLKKLKEMGCEAAILGKAIYEGTLSLTQLASVC